MRRKPIERRARWWWLWRKVRGPVEDYALDRPFTPTASRLLDLAVTAEERADEILNEKRGREEK